MRGSGEDPRGVIGLHRLAVIHHQGAVRDLRDHAHIMRDEEDRHPLFLLQDLEQLQDLRLDRDVERGRRLVGDQQFWLAGQGHRDHHALAHAAGEAMWIFVKARLRRGNANALEQTNGLGLRRRARQASVIDQRLGNLETDGQHRVEAGHRLLEDHGDVVAAHIPHRLFRQRQQIAARELDAALDAAVLVRNQSHDGERGDALARARFTDDRHRLLCGNVERHVAHDGKPLPVAHERGGEA
jgi:hypothetical protein